MYEPKLKKRKSGLPIISHAEIDRHVERYLEDYNPSLLSEPQAVNIENFAEYYLGLNLEYVYLSHCGLILGRMIFREKEMVPVYDPRKQRAEYLCAGRGTLLIDNTLLQDYTDYRFRSTIGHECGHWVYHSDYCTFFDHHITQGIVQPEAAIGCRQSDMDGSTDGDSRKKLISDKDWMEHQANYFSAAILMPKTPFMDAVLELMEQEKLIGSALPNALSKIFQVSPKSAEIRLTQLNLTESIIHEKKISCPVLLTN